MNKTAILLFIVSGLLAVQCGIQREVVVPAETPAMAGLEGLREACKPNDTIRNILISKAESLIITEKERYEATVTLFAVRDSLIYLSAVNSGFEILRASVEPDTIRVIDRLNRIVYKTPVKRRFGHQHPLGFQDLQNIINGYFVCDDLYRAIEQDFTSIVFDFDEAHIKKRISFGRETLKMDKFEFKSKPEVFQLDMSDGAFEEIEHSPCKGLYYRGYFSSYVDSHGTLTFTTRFRFLSRMSCKGCYDCDFLYEYIEEDIKNGVLVFPGTFRNGQLFKIRISGGGRNYFGEVEDIELSLIEVKDETKN